MVQEILVYIILALTFGWTLYKFVHFFDVFKENASGCNSCSSGSCGPCGFNSNKAKPVIFHINKSI